MAVASLRINYVSELGDWELLERSSSEDASVFGELVRRHYRSAVAFCSQVLGDHGHAEDIVQRGFLNIYRARDRYKEKARFKTFLYRVLLNLSINEIHRRSSMTQLSALTHDGEGEVQVHDRRVPDPADVVEEAEGRRVLSDALSRLRPEHRAALWLREHEGLAYQDIADALEASLGEVKIWIHRARKKLMDLVRPYLERGEALP